MKAIILAGAVALIAALLGTPLFIRLMRRLGYGQPIRVEGLQSHESKRGTPTMGGAVFVAASLIGYVAAHALTRTGITASGLLVLMVMTGLALVGFIDDFLKIFRQTSLGLRSGAKVAGQVVVAVVFALEVLQRPDTFDLTPADARLSFL
ncbi:MAG: phospho-N-acetylmuramoyl-pentapeptide-transferase, partial [Nocardiopsaceae bacterium]|nr:phospho-N-acetylmuramoyl-pentapeptide-transferase [Nocardiopsaceae bacterium]